MLAPIALILSLGLGFKAWTISTQNKLELDSVTSQLEVAKNDALTALDAVSAVKQVPVEGGHILPLNSAVSNMILSVHRSAILNGVNIVSISNTKSAESDIALADATTPLPLSAGLLVATPFNIKISYGTYAGLKTFLSSLPEQNIKCSNIKLSGLTATLDVSLLSKSTSQIIS